MNQQLLFRKPVPQALVNDTVGRARHAAYHCEWQEAEIKEITDHAMRSTLSGTIRWWERKQVRPLLDMGTSPSGSTDSHWRFEARIHCLCDQQHVR